MDTKLLLLSFSLVITLFTTGCKEAKEKGPAYSLAQTCVSIKAHDTDQYIIKQNDRYQLKALSTDAIDQAETFYLKPAELGLFLLYDREEKFFGLQNNQLIPLEQPNKRVEWTINHVEIDLSESEAQPTKNNVSPLTSYTLISEHNHLRLQHKGGQLSGINADINLVTPENSSFDFIEQPAELCTPYPEDDLDAERLATFYDQDSNDADNPVIGYVDYHIHLGFPKSMGSVVMGGEVFHRYGVEHALHDCKTLHGHNGRFDLIEQQRSASTSHPTRGYPHFDYWPNRNTDTHIYTYHRWLERAYLSGLRLMVTHATGHPYYCQMLGMMHFDKLEGDCSPSDTVKLQTDYIYDLQNYIDAQAGGPGKGWLRVVTDSVEARAVINENKMAVVLGVEYNTLFDCRSSNKKCNHEYVDRELDKLYRMGIRSIFPIHRFDNAFGGTQPAGISWMHLSSKMNTGEIDHITDLLNPWKLLFKPIGGHFFSMDNCPEGVQGDGRVPSMHQFIDEDFQFLTDKVREFPSIGSYLAQGIDLIFVNKLEPIPDYSHLQTSTSACNTRTLQPVGHHLIHRIIDKGMIVEIDHMSYDTTMETMKILESRNYSGVVSSHGMVRGGDQTRDRIFKLGGHAVTFSGKPSKVINNILHTKKMMEKYDYTLGVSFGTDAQGLVAQAEGDDDFYPEYPFYSYDGHVQFTEPTIGHRNIDFNAEGNAHYGLYAEWIENLRQRSAEQKDGAFELFMNSAEAYLQMWSRAEQAAVE